MAGSLSPKGMLPICQSSSKAEKMWFSRQEWWLSIKKWWFSIGNGHIDLGLGRPEGFRWRRPPARKGRGCPGHGMSWWFQVGKAMVRRGQGTTLFWDLWNLWNLSWKNHFLQIRSVFLFTSSGCDVGNHLGTCPNFPSATRLDRCPPAWWHLRLPCSPAWGRCNLRSNPKFSAR